MARPRHKHVARKPYRPRIVRFGLAASAVLALGTPATAMVWPDDGRVEATPMVTAKPVLVRTSPVPMRVAPITRAEPRVRLQEKPPAVVDHMFATAPLNVRTDPSESSKLLGVLSWSDKIAVTGNSRGKWTEVVIGGRSRWVHSAYLAEKSPKRDTATETSTAAAPAAQPSKQADAQPATPDTAGSAAASTDSASAPASSLLSTAPCATGSDVESGLVANGVTVHRAVCAAFPAITTYGGVRPGDPGDHGTGHALDIMIPDSSTGDQIAAWVREHATELGVSEVIWSQRIWTVQRTSEGWRLMEDRGSTTANHYDHVHVTVY
ncbi:MAG TPA: SH3 domain-containing protein [Nocardioidaceae bacterium]|nr:SH3 domain-containing protein [Nocardioidaceae bacterium]